MVELHLQKQPNSQIQSSSILATENSKPTSRRLLGHTVLTHPQGASTSYLYTVSNTTTVSTATCLLLFTLFGQAWVRRQVHQRRGGSRFLASDAALLVVQVLSLTLRPHALQIFNVTHSVVEDSDNAVQYRVPVPFVPCSPNLIH